MMIIVSILSETGVFNWMGLWAFKISKGRVWPLLTILCFITAFVSAFLDNVTTILLMTPIVIQLCETINIGKTSNPGSDCHDFVNVFEKKNWQYVNWRF
jgi:Na+/H+ antiporter NhaD/arsenite permease-like protein